MENKTPSLTELQMSPRRSHFPTDYQCLDHTCPTPAKVHRERPSPSSTSVLIGLRCHSVNLFNCLQSGGVWHWEMSSTNAMAGFQFTSTQIIIIIIKKKSLTGFQVKRSWKCLLKKIHTSSNPTETKRCCGRRNVCHRERWCKSMIIQGLLYPEIVFGAILSLHRTNYCQIQHECIRQHSLTSHRLIYSYSPNHTFVKQLTAG